MDAHSPTAGPKPLLIPAICAVLGIVGAEMFPVSVRDAFAVAVAACALTLCVPRTWLLWLACGAAFFSLHNAVGTHGAGARLAAQFGHERQIARAQGIVWQEPVPAPASRVGERWRLWLRLDALSCDDLSWPGDATIAVLWTGPAPQVGDRVDVSGSIFTIGPARNPGVFQMEQWLRRNGIHSELRAHRAEDCRIVEPKAGRAAVRWAGHSRRWLQARLTRDLEDEPEIAGLIQSMVLGLRGETPDDIAEEFRRTGTYHLFAVSGLNVALLAVIVGQLFKIVRVPRRTAALLTIPALGAYAAVTGLSPSCVRAAVMAAVILLALRFDRVSLIVNNLAFAALILLGWDTQELFSPGFQFSFVLVLTLILLTRPLAEKWKWIGQPDALIPRKLWTQRQTLESWLGVRFSTAIGVTLAAWLGSLVMTWGYFHLFSIASPLANLIAVPLAFCVLFIGLLSATSAFASTVVSIWFNNANWACAKALLAVVHLFAQVPGGHFFVEIPRRNAPVAEINILDVGEGAALHIRADGRDWLLDCGPASRFQPTLRTYLQTRGVNRLDGLLLSHGDNDHVGAAEETVAVLRPRVVRRSPGKSRSATWRKLVPLPTTARGDQFALGDDARLTVLFPKADADLPVADDEGLIVRIEAAGRRVLYMADAGFNTERWLRENEPDLRADVIVMGWHSRDISGTQDFIVKTGARLVVASWPRFGETQVMFEKWAAPLAARGIRIISQRDAGAVRLDLQPGSIGVRCWATREEYWLSSEN